MRYLIIWAFLIGATALESSGDALVRIGLFERIGMARVAVMVAGATLLFGYGILLNLAPMPFERVVGLYIATLFLVWQIVSFFYFPNGAEPADPGWRSADCRWGPCRHLLGYASGRGLMPQRAERESLCAGMDRDLIGFASLRP